MLCFAPGAGARPCARPTAATSGWRRSSATRPSASTPGCAPTRHRAIETYEGAEDEQVVATVERADLHAALKRLNERDRQLLELRYSEDLTQ